MTAALDTRAGKIGAGVGGTVAFFLAIRILFSGSIALYFNGAALGMLYGLMAVGVILVYRTNRIINFAVAGIGAIPAITAVLLGVKKGVPYPVCLVIAVVGGAGLGTVVDVTLIRRFAKAPRLILTVATLGVSQILAFVAVYIPIWLGTQGKNVPTVVTPWSGTLWRDSGGHPILNGDQVFTFAAVIGVCLALSVFFKRSRIGIALRASAENADRALLLGIPVRAVGTVAWALAGVFGALTVFLRAPLYGVPQDGSLGYNILLVALVAAVIAKFESIPTALVAAAALGIVEQTSSTSSGNPNLATALLVIIALAALLLQRKNVARALDSGQSTWQAVKEFRPIPVELRQVPEVVSGQLLLAVLVVAAAVGAPYVVSRGDLGNLTLIPLYAIVCVSMVILSGWAGQISLGQFALVGVGAAVAGGLAANHHMDFFVCVIAGALAGAVVAIALGIPAMRVQGMYLAVVTLAFAGAAEKYVLSKEYVLHSLGILPKGDAARIERPLLLQRIDLANDRSFYFVCLVALLIALGCARSFRRNRSGRVLIAMRDNQRGAPAYGINIARTRLAAFAVAGGLAGMAGALIAFQQQAVDNTAYGIDASIFVFLVVVIGGLTSIPGAVLGSVVIYGISLFGGKYFPVSDTIRQHVGLLATGPGLLIVLLGLPGGFAQAMFDLRDRFLRTVAQRRGIHVPSLVADRRVEAEELHQAEESVIVNAEQHVLEDVLEEVGS